LTNLVFNAVDALPTGGSLVLRTRVDPADTAGNPGRVVVEVSDNGIGMDEETRRRCIEPFYTTKGERGTGLGLALVYGMIQRHSADFEIDSTPGAGTIVRLAFAEVDTMPTADVCVATSPTSISPLAVLIVDDDPLLIKSLRDILESDGHRVTAATGGQAGIDAFIAADDSGRAFDTVITDLGMPYVDGRKVSAAIKARSPDTPVILLTGWGKRLLADNDIPPYVDRVLSKPPRLAELRGALAELGVGDLPAANAQIDTALQQVNDIKPVNSERVADALVAKARIALALHDVTGGCTVAKQALDLRPPDDPANGWRHAEALAIHGQCLAARNDFTTARTEIQSALAMLQRSRGINHWMTAQVREALRSLPKA